MNVYVCCGVVGGVIGCVGNRWSVCKSEGWGWFCVCVWWSFVVCGKEVECMWGIGVVVF